MHDYLLKEVIPTEYRELKAAEHDIIDEVLGSFNEIWSPQVEGIKVSFKYNPGRFAVGIFLGNGEGERLALNEGELKSLEKIVVKSLYDSLEKRLDAIRIKKEKWE